MTTDFSRRSPEDFQSPALRQEMYCRVLKKWELTKDLAAWSSSWRKNVSQLSGGTLATVIDVDAQINQQRMCRLGRGLGWEWPFLQPGRMPQHFAVRAAPPAAVRLLPASRQPLRTMTSSLALAESKWETWEWDEGAALTAGWWQVGPREGPQCFPGAKTGQGSRHCFPSASQLISSAPANNSSHLPKRSWESSPPFSRSAERWRTLPSRRCMKQSPCATHGFACNSPRPSSRRGSGSSSGAPIHGFTNHRGKI